MTPGATGSPGANGSGALAGGLGASGQPGLGARGPGITGPTIPLGGPTAERERALGAGMLEKWRYFFAEQHKIEQDGDWVSGFLASRELRDCRCTQRPVPGEIVRRLESKDRVPQLEADDDKNTRCELCLLDAYPSWKTRAQKQCALALELSEFELGYLQRSDDGNGLPPRCVDAARAKLSGKPVTSVSGGSLAQQQQQGKGGNAAYIITRAPDAPPPSQGDFVKPSDYAPMPSREDGRVYVRIFTSAACVAEILPGPIQARTGDLLPVPTSARDVTVRGPCGGFVELYFGKEEKPRVSDSFARNQPLRIQLRP
jgi:hypothetical protein